MYYFAYTDQWGQTHTLHHTSPEVVVDLLASFTVDAVAGYRRASAGFLDHDGTPVPTKVWTRSTGQARPLRPSTR